MNTSRNRNTKFLTEIEMNLNIDIGIEIQIEIEIEIGIEVAIENPIKFNCTRNINSIPIPPLPAATSESIPGGT